MMARSELLEAVGGRYRGAPRSERSRILDEFVAVTGYHRKHAIRLLRARSVMQRWKVVCLASSRRWLRGDASMAPTSAML
jgi:hypothetical protein